MAGVEPRVRAKVDGRIVGLKRQASCAPVSIELDIELVDLRDAQ